MLKQTLLKLAVVIAASSVLYFGYQIIWPIIDAEGIIEVGEYRGIDIGDTKDDVILKTTTPVYGNKLRIEAYRSRDGRTIPVFARGQASHLRDSNTWYLAYPGLHKETITLVFEGEIVQEIRYRRDMLAP